MFWLQSVPDIEILVYYRAQDMRIVVGRGSRGVIPQQTEMRDSALRFLKVIHFFRCLLWQPRHAACLTLQPQKRAELLCLKQRCAQKLDSSGVCGWGCVGGCVLVCL